MSAKGCKVRAREGYIEESSGLPLIERHTLP